MPIALDPHELTEYVLEAERSVPEHSKTIFTIGPLTVAQMRSAENKLQPKKRGDLEVPGSRVDFVLEILRGGLRGWVQFRTRAGVDVSFDVLSDGRPKDETLARLNRHDQDELAEAVLALGKLSESDVGK